MKLYKSFILQALIELQLFLKNILQLCDIEVLS